MRPLSPVRRVLVSAAVAALTLAGAAPGFAATTRTGAPAHTAPFTSASAASASALLPPVSSPAHKPDDPLLYARVRNGVYTVDGMVAKIKLNYDVEGASFLYLFVPGVGTAVVSAAPQPGALLTPASLEGDELSFTADGHRFDLTGLTVDRSKTPLPEHLYVHLDRAAWHLGRMPMVGFGSRAGLPYEWPGALPEDADTAAQEEEQSSFTYVIPATLLPSLSRPARPAPDVTNPDATTPAATTPAAPATLRPASLR